MTVKKLNLITAMQCNAINKLNALNIYRLWSYLVQNVFKLS